MQLKSCTSDFDLLRAEEIVDDMQFVSAPSDVLFKFLKVIVCAGCSKSKGVNSDTQRAESSGNGAKGV